MENLKLRSIARRCPNESTSSCSWPGISRFPRFGEALRSLCSGAGTCPAMQMCAPPPSGAATPGTRLQEVSPRSGQSSPSVRSPNPRIGHGRRRLPRAFSVAASPLISGNRSVVGPRHGPERPLHAQRPSEANPQCLPRYDVCGPLPSCPRRSPAAPFFRGLGRLAVDAGRTGCGLASLAPSLLFAQLCMDAFPVAALGPLAEVILHCGPGREIVRQAAPCASVSNHVEQCVQDVSKVDFSRASPLARRRQQGQQHLPFGVRQVCRIRFSCHASTLTTR